MEKGDQIFFNHFQSNLRREEKRSPGHPNEPWISVWNKEDLILFFHFASDKVDPICKKE